MNERKKNVMTNMRKKLFANVMIFFLIIFVCLSSFNLKVFASTNLYSSTNSILINLKSNSYKLIKTDTGKVKIEMDDFSNGVIPNKPALPGKVFNVLLPPLSTLKSVEIINETKEDLGYGYRVVETPPLISDSGPLSFDNENEDFSVVKTLETSDMRKWHFVRIRFVPFEYTEYNGHLVLVKDVTLKITFDKNNQVPESLLKDDVLDNFAKGMFINYDSAKELGYVNPASYSKTSTTGTSNQPTYLILTTSTIQTSHVLDDFIRLKSAFGFNVSVVTVDSNDIQNQKGRDLPEKIRNYLKSVYIANNIKYVLIIGSINTIPMRYCYPNPTYHDNSNGFDPEQHKIPTDYYYADLTGDWDSDNDGYFGEYGQDNIDLTPDVIVGRIPFDDALTVSNVLSRIKQYILDTTGSWKKKALLLGAITNYKNENSTGWDKTDGAAIMEAMWNDFLKPNGYTRTTMYEKEGLSPSTYTCDYPLNEDNVVTHWKNDGGYGIVAWYAHGLQNVALRQIWEQDKNNDGVPQRDDENPDINEMKWLPFISVNDAKNLDTNHPSVVFSGSCLNSYPENLNNLSASLLKYSCASVIGSTRESWGSAGWNSPDYSSNATIEYYTLKHYASDNMSLGDAFFKAKVDNANLPGTEWKTLANTYDFNLYGDPSLTSGQLLSPPVLDHFDFSVIRNQPVNTPFEITITAKDQYGNTYTGFNSSVTLSVNKGTISPTVTSNFVNGVLSNFKVSISDINPDVTITATSQDGKSGTSNSFNVNPVITTSSAGQGGSVSPSGNVMVDYGDSATFIITPDKGYKVSDVKVDGVSVMSNLIDNNDGSYTYIFNSVTSCHTIEANFAGNTCTITALAGQGGTITPSGTVVVNAGTNQTFTITPNPGYHIDDVKVDGVSIGAVSTYTFEDVVVNHTIEASFEREQIVIVLQVGQTSFTVNGSPNTLDSPPIIKNGRTLLPIRPVVEALGGTVSWDGTERKVTISLGSTTIELWIGKNTARVNGVSKPIDSTNSKVVPEIINGRTMLPLRFVTENLGCQLQWDPNTKTITITYQG